MRISEMASGRTAGHEEGMRADIMARRGPEDAALLTMFDLFCSTSLEKCCQMASPEFKRAAAAAEPDDALEGKTAACGIFN